MTLPLWLFIVLVVLSSIAGLWLLCLFIFLCIYGILNLIDYIKAKSKQRKEAKITTRSLLGRVIKLEERVKVLTVFLSIFNYYQNSNNSKKTDKKDNSKKGANKK